MELFLNFSWLAVTCLLFLSVGWAHSRGKLHLSLKLALGCCVVLALLLFPVISMTDDLQQAQLLSEGHWAGIPDTSHETSAATALGCAIVLLSLLLLALATTLIARLFDSRKTFPLLARRQPSAVRPPPFLLSLLAA